MRTFDHQPPSAFLAEQRARLNPHGKSLTDVMVEGCGIERGWLRMFRPPWEDGLWSVSLWWLGLSLCGVGLGLLVAETVRAFR